MAVTPLPLSSLTRSQHASPQVQQRSIPTSPAPQRIEQRRAVADESDVGDVTAEASLSYEEDVDVDDDDAAQESQSVAQESQSLAHSYVQPQEEEEAEISFDEDE
jgi:hypothetical protein